MIDFKTVYKGKKAFVTGHTGFKGSWLSLWLQELGAEVTGYALAPETRPSHFELLNPEMDSIEGDIRDRQLLQRSLERSGPDVVFHLAAQPLVRRSYEEPVETFETNIMGTVNVLEACRNIPSVRAIIVITSDKCYENRERNWGYSENDPMGGYDPYSASKGAAELVTSAYRRSFFNPEDYGTKHKTLIATCRAGNVIGGGDWSRDRLIPDIVRGVEAGSPAVIRSPNAIRPWQHVLDALSGYLLLGQRLLEGSRLFAEAWNFGPPESDALSVREICKLFEKNWEKAETVILETDQSVHEAGVLKLNCSKANSVLRWKGRWSAEKAVEKTAQWYRAYYEENTLISREQLGMYMEGE